MASVADHQLLLAALDVLKWVDDLYPFSEAGSEPAPCFQRLRDAVRTETAGLAADLQANLGKPGNGLLTAAEEEDYRRHKGWPLAALAEKAAKEGR